MSITRKCPYIAASQCVKIYYQSLIKNYLETDTELADAELMMPENDQNLFVEEIELNEFANNLVASYVSRKEGMVNMIASINPRDGTDED